MSTDNENSNIVTDEAIKHLSDFANKEIEAGKKEPSFSDAFEFNNLFRVKGKKGLHVQISAIRKNGLVGMKSFVGAETCTVNINDLECLGHFGFELLERRASDNRDAIGIAEVFDNIHKIHKSDFSDMLIETKMGIMVPGYNPNEFKDYYAEKVLAWYYELVDAVSDMENTAIVSTPNVSSVNTASND